MPNNEQAGVAIVDDEAYVVRTYELLFKRRHIPLAFTALEGGEAVEKFKISSPRPIVVIIDYRLPSMSGIELMEKIMAIEPDTKITFISGDDSIRDSGLMRASPRFPISPRRAPFPSGTRRSAIPGT